MDRLMVRNEEENNPDTDKKMKSKAVIGFIGLKPNAKFFIVSLLICHPTKTINGRTKTIHVNALEQFLRKSIPLFTRRLLVASFFLE
jgi:hypothetical protein